MTEVKLETTRDRSGQELLTLQYLRAVAVMGVVYFHTMLGLSHASQRYTGTSALGSFGVDLFFTISGFIMFYISVLRRPAPSNFLLAWLLRIAPTYWLATVAMFLAPLVSRTIGWSSTLDPRQLATSLTFIGGIQWPGAADDLPVYRAGWTINYEILFYVLFAVGVVVHGCPRSDHVMKAPDGAGP